jgi:hypothetical protein
MVGTRMEPSLEELGTAGDKLGTVGEAIESTISPCLMLHQIVRNVRKAVVAVTGTVGTETAGATSSTAEERGKSTINPVAGGKPPPKLAEVSAEEEREVLLPVAGSKSNDDDTAGPTCGAFDNKQVDTAGDAGKSTISPRSCAEEKRGRIFTDDTAGPRCGACDDKQIDTAGDTVESTISIRSCGEEKRGRIFTERSGRK